MKKVCCVNISKSIERRWVCY